VRANDFTRMPRSAGDSTCRQAARAERITIGRELAQELAAASAWNRRTRSAGLLARVDRHPDEPRRGRIRRRREGRISPAADRVSAGPPKRPAGLYLRKGLSQGRASARPQASRPIPPTPRPRLHEPPRRTSLAPLPQNPDVVVIGRDRPGSRPPAPVEPGPRCCGARGPGSGRRAGRYGSDAGPPPWISAPTGSMRGRSTRWCASAANEATDPPGAVESHLVVGRRRGSRREAALMHRAFGWPMPR
jgi:hypothetical protein